MSRTIPAVALLLILLAVGLAPPLAAQGQDASSNPFPDDREAERIVTAARAEQARFERIRRNNLPWIHRRGGSCDPSWGDERIGRFCLMHGESGDDFEAPPEAEQTIEARARLLRVLTEANERLPWNGWVIGQRVRYLMESGDAESAAFAAHDCAAAGWWCAALTGYVHHYAGDPERADSAYSGALASMPETVSEHWLDLSPVLEGPTLRSYSRLRPEERDDFLARFWKLSRLLYMQPGNDLRSEHLSRNVLDALQYRARSVDAISWGDDLREILLRYGWPKGWQRVRDTTPYRPAGPSSLMSYYSSGRVDRLPPHALLFPADEVDLLAGEWDVESRRLQSGYNVPGRLSTTRWLVGFDHQFARFRRPDGARVVAAYEVAPDSLPGAEGDITAALASFDPRSEGPVIHRFDEPGYQSAIVATVEPGETVLSLELLSLTAARAGRVRTMMLLPTHDSNAFALSDLLLLHSPQALPDSLAAAVPLARGSTRLHPGESVGLYWEIYGLAPDRPESFAVTLSLVNPNTGWLRRAAQRIGLVGENAPVRLRWQEQGSPGGYIPRSMSLQIPNVAPGAYRLELTVERGDGSTAVSERHVEIVSG